MFCAKTMTKLPDLTVPYFLILSVYALMVFKVFQKLFTTLFPSLKLLTILKMLTETLLRILFSVIGRRYLSIVRGIDPRIRIHTKM